MTMTARHRRALEDQAKAWEAFKEIDDRRNKAGYTETTEDGEGVTRSLDDLDRLGGIIKEEERAAATRTALAGLNTPAEDQRSTNPTGEQRDGAAHAAAYRSAFGSFMRSGMEGVDLEGRQLLQRGFVSGSEFRAQGSSVGAAGGYTVPPEFRNELIAVMKAYGGIVSLANVITTDSGAELPWPTVDTTGAKGRRVSQNQQLSEQDVVFGKDSLQAWIYTSDIVKVSFALLEDTGFNLEGFLTSELGERIGRITAEEFATGDGTNMPQGLVTGLDSGVTTGTIGKVSYDDLVNLEHSINSVYRDAATYVLNDTALREIRKIKDADGKPLYASGSVVGAIPATINGRPFTSVDDLPEFAAGETPIVYGDIKKAYVVRQVNGIQTMRLTERYADALQVGFLAFARFDGKVQQKAAAKKLTVKAASA